MRLRDKNILMLSPQAWGRGMRISKHHYASELAARGNHVWFVDPPARGRGPMFRARSATGVANVTVVQQQLFFPEVLKFKLFGIYRVLMREHVRQLMRFLGEPIDLVWCFDYHRGYALDWFRPSRTLFHPVDFIGTQRERRTAIGAGLILSVAQEILDALPDGDAPKRFLHHGLSAPFAEIASRPARRKGTKLKVGYSGNLTRSDVDANAVLEIVRSNPGVEFHFWGNTSASEGALGGSDAAETRAFVAELRATSNVYLHGMVASVTLAEGFAEMDAFLLAYDIAKDVSHGTNYHKVMEYLAAGGVIISSNITTYADRPDLVTMVPERHNEGLPALFAETIANLDDHNTADRIEARKRFAASNVYSRHVDQIEEWLMHPSKESVLRTPPCDPVLSRVP